MYTLIKTIGSILRQELLNILLGFYHYYITIIINMMAGSVRGQGRHLWSVLGEDANVGVAAFGVSFQQECRTQIFHSLHHLWTTESQTGSEADRLLSPILN